MEHVDGIRIVFSEDTKNIMNLCLAFLMFGVALDMTPDDFRRVSAYPKAVITGLTSQLILLPLLTLVLIAVWQPWPSIALGLIMIAACPGGNISNFAVHLGKGNTALSVTMTSVVTISAMIMTPMIFGLCAQLLPSTTSILAEISVEPLRAVQIILQLILVPLALGMWINYRFPGLVMRVRRPVRILSILLFAGFIAGALFANRMHIVNHLHLVFLLVVVHNIVALSAGHLFARVNRLDKRDARAIGMETGIQNAGLGIVLIMNFFSDLGGMMLVAAFWGVWDLVSSFFLSLYWSRRPVPEPVPVVA